MTMIIMVGKKAACLNLKHLGLCSDAPSTYIASRIDFLDQIPAGFEKRVEGMDAFGNLFWTTESGLVYLMPVITFGVMVTTHGGMEEATKMELANCFVPSADWLYSFHKEHALPSMSEWLTKELFKITTAGKLEAAAEKLAKEEALNTELASLDVPATEEFRSLLTQVKWFDYSYHYSDDGSVYRNRSNQEKNIREAIKDYPKFVALFSLGFSKL